MKSYKQKFQLGWLIATGLLFTASSFLGCGKNNDGGPAAQNPGLIGISNNCGPFGCFGATTGQQITTAVGGLNYDDNLDSSTTSTQSRLMDLTLNINMWQTNNNGLMGAPSYPMAPNGLAFSGAQQLLSFFGPVQVSGQLNVLGTISECNIPQGTYNVQALRVGQLNYGSLTAPLSVNVNGGKGFTIMLEGINVVSNTMAPIGGSIGVQNYNSSQSRLYGLVRIPECKDSTFRVE